MIKWDITFHLAVYFAKLDEPILCLFSLASLNDQEEVFTHSELLGCFGVSSDHMSCRYHIYWYFTARSYQHPYLVLRHIVIPNFSMYPLQLLVCLYHWNVLIGSYGLWRWELVQRINDEMTGSSQKYVFSYL